MRPQIKKVLDEISRYFAVPLIVILCVMLTGTGARSDPKEVDVAFQPPSSTDMKVTEPEGQLAEVIQGPNVYIEVNLPATELTLYEDGKVVFVKKVAIGSSTYRTPLMESEIKRLEWNPWWIPPPSKWAANAHPTPPGKGNPLGQVKMPISSAILFHGTNKEATVGHPASHGCMRMFNADAEEMAWFLQSRFSSKTDSTLRDMYKKNRGTTYVVPLNTPVPVRLVYRPVEVKGENLVLYPDYYGKLGAKKKAAIMDALSQSGLDSSHKIDESKIDELIKKWPKKESEELSIDSLVEERPVKVAASGE